MDQTSAEVKAWVARVHTPDYNKQRKNPIGSTLTPEERSKILAALESANRELKLFPQKK